MVTSLKSFKQKIRNWNLIAHVGYVKSICNLWVSSNDYVFSLLSLLLGSLLTYIWAVLLLTFIGFLYVRSKSTLNKEEINICFIYLFIYSLFKVDKFTIKTDIILYTNKYSYILIIKIKTC